MNRQFAVESRLAETLRDYIRQGQPGKVRDLGFDPHKVTEPYEEEQWDTPKTP